jgi:glutamine amidotransferase
MIAIIDYGLGNIRAFANVYKRLNMPFAIFSGTEDFQKKEATKIILPGVGAFDHAMERLQQSGMREILDDLVLQCKLPVLGICVGMQMLARSSEEGRLPGLGWFNGVVKKIDTSLLTHRTRLPHMGWNDVNPTRNSDLFHDLDIESRFYFLHSYYFQCHNNQDVIAVTDYGTEFPCAVNSKNIYGAQFHPEKSHQNGIQFLKNFGNL